MQISHRAQIMLYVLMLVVREHTSSGMGLIENGLGDASDSYSVSERGYHQGQGTYQRQSQTQTHTQGQYQQSTYQGQGQGQAVKQDVAGNTQGPRMSLDTNRRQSFTHNSLHSTHDDALKNSSTSIPTGRPPVHGLLLYLNGDATKCETIQPKWTEICSLIISRNDLACNIKHSASLVSTVQFSMMWYSC